MAIGVGLEEIWQRKHAFTNRGAQCFWYVLAAESFTGS